MIAMVLLSILQLSACAVPTSKDHDSLNKEQDISVKVPYSKLKERLIDPTVISVDGIEGLLYDIPEYDDPHMIDYQLSAMGRSPILSLLQIAKERAQHKKKETSSKENLAVVKEILDDVISRLMAISNKIDAEKGEISYSDIEKSIHGLRRIESQFRSNKGQLLRETIHQTVSIASPVIEPKVLAVKSIPTHKPTHEPKIVTEEPFLSTTKYEEEIPQPPVVVAAYKTEKAEKKGDEDEKINYKNNKWTWKSSSFV